MATPSTQLHQVGDSQCNHSCNSSMDISKGITPAYLEAFVLCNTIQQDIFVGANFHINQGFLQW